MAIMLIIALSVLPLLNIAGHLSIQFAAISTIILVRKLQGEQIGAAMKSERDGINVLQVALNAWPMAGGSRCGLTRTCLTSG